MSSPNIQTFFYTPTLPQIITIRDPEFNLSQLQLQVYNVNNQMLTNASVSNVNLSFTIEVEYVNE